MTTFNNLYIEGFGSIDNLVIPLNNGGLTFLRGENGIGKSTILNALVWGLYGEHPKGLLTSQVPTWDYLRKENFRGTRVIVTMVKDGVFYMSARHYKFKGTTKALTAPNELLVFRNELGFDCTASDLINDQHKGDVQQYLCDMLEIDFKGFSNAVFFAQKAKRFLEEDGKEKRELFDNLFSTGWIEEAKELAKTALAKEENRLQQERQKLIICGDRGKAVSNEIATAEQFLQSFEAQRIGRKEREVTKYTSEKEQLTKRRENCLAASRNYAVEYLEKLEKLKVTLELRSKTVEGFREDLQKLQLIPLQPFDPETQRKAREALQTAETTKENLERAIRSKNSTVKDYGETIAKNKRSIEKSLNDLKAVLENCPTCGEPLAKDKVAQAKEAIEGQIADFETANKLLEDGIVKANGEIARLNEDLSKIDFTVLQEQIARFRTVEEDNRKIARSIEKAGDDLRNAEKDVEFAEKNIQNHEQEKEQRFKHLDEALEQVEKDIEKSISSHLQRIEDIHGEQPPKIDIEGLRTNLKGIDEDYKLIGDEAKKIETEIEHLRFWVSTGFAAKGVRSYIFETMLNQLNGLLELYAFRVGFKVTFSIDLSKASKPFITNVQFRGHTTEYKELSGGQQGRVNAVVLFAMYDLISNGKLNFIMLDEPFASLDDMGIETFFEILQLKIKEGVNVFCVTHKKEIDTINAKSIYLTGEKGITKVA